MQIVVLAGGLATRMHPETERIPKSLLPVNGRPFIDWQLEGFAASGATSVLLCVAHLASQIVSHVAQRHPSLAVRYSYDGERLVGTGGALMRAVGELADDFVLTYGDSYLPFDYAAPLRDLRAHPQALATMSVYQNRGRLDPSNVAIQGRDVVTYEKGRPAGELDYIDYGAIALRRSALERFEGGAVWDVATLLGKLARERKLRAHVVSERFYEVGTPAGRHDFERYLRDERQRDMRWPTQAANPTEDARG